MTRTTKGMVAALASGAIVLSLAACGSGGGEAAAGADEDITIRRDNNAPTEGIQHDQTVQ